MYNHKYSYTDYFCNGFDLIRILKQTVELFLNLSNFSFINIHVYYVLILPFNVD